MFFVIALCSCFCYLDMFLLFYSLFLFSLFVLDLVFVLLCWLLFWCLPSPFFLRYHCSCALVFVVSFALHFDVYYLSCFFVLEFLCVTDSALCY